MLDCADALSSNTQRARTPMQRMSNTSNHESVKRIHLLSEVSFDFASIKPDPLGAATVQKACPVVEGSVAKLWNQSCAMSANHPPVLGLWLHRQYESNTCEFLVCSFARILHYRITCKLAGDSERRFPLPSWLFLDPLVEQSIRTGSRELL